MDAKYADFNGSFTIRKVAWKATWEKIGDLSYSNCKDITNHYVRKCGLDLSEWKRSMSL